MNVPIYDFIIIGGGPTGSTAAYYLAKYGYKVMVFEKYRFPRQHEGESLLPFCNNLFMEIGIFDEMRRHFVRKPGVRFTNSSGESSATWCFKNILPDKDQFLAFHVLRADFDNMLLNHARKHGATAKEETRVESVELQNPDGLVHVATCGADGAKENWKCRFIIDASGQDTFLARRMQNKTAYKELDRVAFLNHWKGTKYLQGIDVGLLQIVYLPQHKGGWFGVQPVGKDRLSVGLVVNRQYLKEQKEKLVKSGVSNWQEAFYRQEVKACPLTADITENAETIQKMIIVSDYSYYAEQTIGENFVMLGDAGKFLDPIFASGVYLGMNSAKLFAQAIHTKLSFDKAKGEEELKIAKARIDGAYNLVEKFINIFYDPDSFNLAEVSSTSESKFRNYEMAFLLVHFLLAGDFFNKYETYSDFLDMLRSPKQFARWKSLVVNRTHHEELHCGVSMEDVFGEIVQELVDQSMANVVPKED